MTNAKFEKLGIDLAYVESLTNTSARMRYLHSQIGTYYGVAAYMNALMPRSDEKTWRVQHVRNVVMTPVKNPK